MDVLISEGQWALPTAMSMEMAELWNLVQQVQIHNADSDIIKWRNNAQIRNTTSIWEEIR